MKNTIELTPELDYLAARLIYLLADQEQSEGIITTIDGLVLDVEIYVADIPKPKLRLVQ